MKRTIIAVTLLAVLVAIVLVLRPARTQEDAPIRVGDGLVLGEPIRMGNLAVWPVIAEELPDLGAFRTLAEAQQRGELGIHEREEAEVDTLVIENRGDVPILACAGALFAGGKQDRQLGEDIVVAAKTTVPVKTFCVEAGRWSGGRTFRVLDAKTTRTVRAAGQYNGDQGGVWRNVDQARASMGLSNGSYRAVAEERQEPVARVVAHLRDHGGDVVGYAYAVHGKMKGMRTFAHPKLFKPRLEALVRAVCAESGQTVSPEELSELRRMTIYMRMASDAFDDSEYDLAQAHAEKVLALEPNNERAKELLSIAKESRYVADQDEIRKEFHKEWHTVIAQLETTMLASPRVQRYLQDAGVAARGLGTGTNLDDSFVGSSANPEILRYPKSRGEISRRQPKVAGSARRQAPDSRSEQILSTLSQKRVYDLKFESGEITLSAAIQYLRSVTGLNFVLSQRVKENKADTEIDLSLDDVSARQVLDLLTEPNGLEWKALNDAVLISVIGEARDFVPPQITQVGVSENESRGRVENLFDVILDFTDGIEGDISGFVEQEITLVPAVGERVVQTKGINRNTFRTTANGNRSTCSILGKDGRWITLTRDWTAR